MIRVKDVERSGRGTTETYYPSIRLKEVRKVTKRPSIRIAGLRPEI
jgi:hypothetical protein